MRQSQPDLRLEVPAPERVLTDSDVEAIADATARRLAELVGTGPTTFRLVDARQLARDLDVSLDYVCAHATELGAMRLGFGPKARIRFDLDRAREALVTRTERSNGRRGRQGTLRTTELSSRRPRASQPQNQA
jgi:hypothetical protein